MKNCLIVINTHKKKSRELGSLILEYLKLKGISGSIYCFDGFSTENPFSGYDFVITLGGDGTVLYAARCCAELCIPVFPINLGEFGFIASIQVDEWEKELDSFVKGESKIVERNLVQAIVISEASGTVKFSGVGLNEIVLSAKTSVRMINFDVAFNYVSLGTFKADGIIISTATGSTAYSASVGGPIMDPDLEALLLTPINSFSLSSRPLLLSPKGEVEIKILDSREREAILTLDGQKPVDLLVGDCIKIRQTPYKINLVGCTAERFYEALQSKLNWSGGPHA